MVYTSKKRKLSIWQGLIRIFHRNGPKEYLCSDGLRQQAVNINSTTNYMIFVKMLVAYDFCIKQISLHIFNFLIIGYKVNIIGYLINLFDVFT